MPTLTPTQLAIAGSYIDTDYAHSDIVGYYTYLESLGVSYGNLALGVVQNNTTEGQIANVYAASVALDKGIDLSVGSDDWKALVFNVASEDIAMRELHTGADLTFQNYDDIHSAAFNDTSSALGPETWTAHTPLSTLNEVNPVAANAAWNDMISGSGSLLDQFQDGFVLTASGVAVDPAEGPVHVVNELAAEAQWMANMGVAMYVVGDTAVESVISTGHTAFWSDFDNFKSFLSDKYGAGAPELAPWSQSLLDPDLDPAHALASALTSAIQPAFATAISAASPLVIDLSSGHTDVTLTTWSASSTSTFFDLNDNGFAVQTAWVSGNTGLLARDLNSNGKIDSSAELFGSPTVDGFAKLAALDSNHDLRIDANDTAWSSLVVWKDDNGDAVTEAGELYSLASLGIASIDLAGVASSTSTISGNPISHTSSVTFTSGATAAIDDAWFVHDNTNSFVTDYSLTPDVLFLPDLRGYGTLPDLAAAMSSDTDLKSLVTDFANDFSLADIASAGSAITDILYKWAEVDGVDPGSRGDNIDAQHLEFLEHVVGSDFVQAGYDSANPQASAAADLEGAYQTAFNMFSADLLIQVGVGQLFETPITYNPATGAPSGDMSLSHTEISDLASIAPSGGTDNEAFWVAIAGVLDTIKGIVNLTTDEASWLNSAVTTSNALLDWSAVLNSYYHDAGTNSLSGTSGADTIYGGTADDTIHGYAGDDIIHGSFGNDTIYGDDGNNVLYGDAGNDILTGGSGNDILYGGDGNDTLTGGGGSDTFYGEAGGNILNASTGNDTFVYGGGDDVIADAGGTDQIILPSGVTLGDLTFSRVSTDNSSSEFDDLLIQIAGSGTIQIHGHFYSSSLAVETLVFSDSSTLNLSTLAPDVHLTNGNDNFSGAGNASYTVYGHDGNDTIYTSGTGAHTIDGGNGNDTMEGGTSSNDTYIASPGFDKIEENYGTDTIVVPVGYTIDDVTFYRINNSSGPTNDLGISIHGLGEIDVTSHFSSSAYAVENMHFLDDNSTISLTDLSITTLGTAGNDTLYAPTADAGPNDIMDGREGNDTLYGGAGDDTYIMSAGHDTINESGAGGDDTIHIRDSYSPANITMYFDANQDLQLFDSDGNNMTVHEQGISASYGIEHVAFSDSTVWNLGSMEIETHGTSGADYLVGSDVGDASSNDTIYGYAGNDTIHGGNGDDVIYGGDGNDNIRGDAGNDTIYGGDGDDSIYASGSDGSDTVHGDAGNDSIYGVANSVLYGDDGNDSIYNNASSGDAATTLITMYGGDGVDNLYGGYGETIMDGGKGADVLHGNTGVDVFKFDAASAFDAVDTIQTFNKAGGDKLDISDILDGNYNPATDVITNFVQIQTNGSNSELFVDTTGTGTFNAADHIATISSVTGLTDEAALLAAHTLVAA